MKKFFSIVALACMLASCHTGKDAALADLRSLTAQIEQNATVYDYNDWMRVKKRFEKVDNRLMRYDYTADESHEIGELKGRSLGYIAKGVVTKAGDKIIDAASQIKGILDGIQKVLNQ